MTFAGRTAAAAAEESSIAGSSGVRRVATDVSVFSAVHGVAGASLAHVRLAAVRAAVGPSKAHPQLQSVIDSSRSSSTPPNPPAFPGRDAGACEQPHKEMQHSIISHC